MSFAAEARNRVTPGLLGSLCQNLVVAAVATVAAAIAAVAAAVAAVAHAIAATIAAAVAHA